MTAASRSAASARVSAAIASATAGEASRPPRSGTGATATRSPSAGNRVASPATTVRASSRASGSWTMSGTGSTVGGGPGPWVRFGTSRAASVADVGVAARDGLVLHELTPLAGSLEDAYLALTQDEVEYHAGGESA